MNARHPHRKRGLAITPVKFGISFTATFFNQAGALVLIYRDGSVQVNHGGAEMGQGLHTKIQQIAAESLGVDLESVRVMPTRTDKVPNTSATAASAGADLNGAAVADACSQLRSRLAEVACSDARLRSRLRCVYRTAACLWRRRRQRVDSVRESVRGGLSRASAAIRARILSHARNSLRSANAAGQAVPLFRLRARRSPKWKWTASPATIGFCRTDILEDVGDSVSPIVDRGQIEGGFIQGVGWLTVEELVWDSEGRLATAGASTYKLPSWTEVPGRFRSQLPRTSRRARRHLRQQSRGRTSSHVGYLSARGDPRRHRRIRRGRARIA